MPHCSWSSCCCTGKGSRLHTTVHSSACASLPHSDSYCLHPPTHPPKPRLPAAPAAAPCWPGAPGPCSAAGAAPAAAPRTPPQHAAASATARPAGGWPGQGLAVPGAPAQHAAKTGGRTRPWGPCCVPRQQLLPPWLLLLLRGRWGLRHLVLSPCSAAAWAALVACRLAAAAASAAAGAAVLPLLRQGCLPLLLLLLVPLR